MKKKSFVFPLLLLFSILILTGSSNVFAQDKKFETILGTWDIEADIDMQIMNFVVTFEIVEEKITGKFTSDAFGEAELTNIKLEEKALSFDFVLAEGMAVSTECTVEEDEVSGTFYADEGTAEFTGKKRKKDGK
ncbi:hypothetical protein ACFL6G_00440 [candidate division KSB1 bacterium]